MCGAPFISDYQGSARDNRYVHLFWNDSRAGTQELFTGDDL
jgi:hypothetical protein